MAKRQNFVVGSTNPVTVTKTQAELNNGWNKYEVLKAGDLDGVFNAVSDYSNDSSQEIANAIQTLTGAQPTGNSQNELAGALEKMREDIETSSLTFKGYVATSEPSSSTYGLVVGNLWINDSTMPTTFPVAIAGVWNGTTWETTTDTYTPKDFDFFRDINDNEGYYWFGGQWTVMSTDMSTTYFTLNQTSGKWEIKSSVNLPGNPTTTTPTSSSPDDQIATKKYVDEAIAPLPTTTYFPDLFDAKWADHICNDVQWLRGDTFSWQSGAVYQVAYEHLVDDYNEGSAASYWSPAIQDTNLGGNYWDGLVWDGSKFVALGADGHISTSTDGTNWAPAVQDSNLGAHDWYALAWNGSKFVALGNTGYISTSTDGTNWTAAVQDSNLGVKSWFALAWDGSKFVALGSAGYISTSTDGTNWTAAVQDSNLGSRANWKAVAWSGSKFVALGADGHISTSTDGTNWSPAVQDTNLGENYWFSLAWNGSKFVALGNDGYISTSADGTNWTPAVQDTNLGAHDWYNLAWNGSKFVALGQSGYTAIQTSYQTETIAGVTIEYYLAPDGHKLVLPDQESNVMAIYNATGVAWYYIIDTTNQRFKLPRINPDLEELAYQISAFGDGDYLRFMSSSDSYKGSYINSHTETLGTGTGWLRTYNSGGALVDLGNMKLSDVKGQSGIKVEKDTIFSGKKYLYFYVGNFTQTALENTAGVTTEVLNTKVTVGHEVVEFQAPTAANNYTWYRKYADGWVEQGGQTTPTEYGSDGTTVTLPVEMANTHYQVSVTQITPRRDGLASTVIPAGYASSTTQIWIGGRWVQASESASLGWVVYGMAAS